MNCQGPFEFALDQTAIFVLCCTDPFIPTNKPPYTVSIVISRSLFCAHGPFSGGDGDVSVQLYLLCCVFLCSGSFSLLYSTPFLLSCPLSTVSSLPLPPPPSPIPYYSPVQFSSVRSTVVTFLVFSCHFSISSLVQHLLACRLFQFVQFCISSYSECWTLRYIGICIIVHLLSFT